MAEKQAADVSSVRSNPTSQLPRVVKNPLLSASVTGITFDDFPNKPLLLPAAPPIVHTTSVIPGPISSKEAESLVTVGHSSKLDNENLDEINLNSSEDSSKNISSSNDQNANSFLDSQNTGNSDSILSQAASSFSALPAVASNVFSTFSKRLYAGSRESTPTSVNTNIQDFNANPELPAQRDLRTFDPNKPILVEGTTLPPPPQFFAPPPPTQIQQQSGGQPNPSLLAEQPSAPAASTEPPKFYTPAEIPAIPALSAPPPSTAAGQNSYRLTVKKKLYAPIPGLSEQTQPSSLPPQQASLPIPDSQSYFNQTSTLSASSKPQEERKGGLFSLGNFVPSGVYKNISGLVQSATGTFTDKSEARSTSSETNYFGAQSYDSSESFSIPSNPYGNPEVAAFFSQPPSSFTGLQPSASLPTSEIGSENLPKQFTPNSFNQQAAPNLQGPPIFPGYNFQPIPFSFNRDNQNYSAEGIALPPPPPVNAYQPSTTASYPPPPPLVNQPQALDENAVNVPPLDLLPTQEPSTPNQDNPSSQTNKPDIVAEPVPSSAQVNPLTIFDLTRQTTNTVDLLRKRPSADNNRNVASVDQIVSPPPSFLGGPTQTDQIAPSIFDPFREPQSSASSINPQTSDNSETENKQSNESFNTSSSEQNEGTNSFTASSFSANQASSSNLYLQPSGANQSSTSLSLPAAQAVVESSAPSGGVLQPSVTPSLPATGVPPGSTAHPPSSVSGVPPPSAGTTSFRLQKGTRLYKSPLTTNETAPSKVNQVWDTSLPPYQQIPQSSLINPFVPPKVTNQIADLQTVFNPVQHQTPTAPANPFIAPPVAASQGITLFNPCIENNTLPPSNPYFPPLSAADSGISIFNPLEDNLTQPKPFAPDATSASNQTVTLFKPPEGISFENQKQSIGPSTSTNQEAQFVNATEGVNVKEEKSTPDPSYVPVTSEGVNILKPREGNNFELQNQSAAKGSPLFDTTKQAQTQSFPAGIETFFSPSLSTTQSIPLFNPNTALETQQPSREDTDQLNNFFSKSTLTEEKNEDSKTNQTENTHSIEPLQSLFVKETPSDNQTQVVSSLADSNPQQENRQEQVVTEEKQLGEESTSKLSEHIQEIFFKETTSHIVSTPESNLKKIDQESSVTDLGQSRSHLQESLIATDQETAVNFFKGSSENILPTVQTSGSILKEDSLNSSFQNLSGEPESAPLPAEPHIATAPPLPPPPSISSTSNQVNPYRKAGATHHKSPSDQSSNSNLLANFFTPFGNDSSANFPRSDFDQFSSNLSKSPKLAESSSDLQQKEEPINFFQTQTKPVEVSLTGSKDTIPDITHNFFQDQNLTNNPSGPAAAFSLSNLQQTSITPLGFDRIATEIENNNQVTETTSSVPSTNNLDNLFNQPEASKNQPESSINSQSNDYINNPSSFFDNFSDSSRDSAKSSEPIVPKVVRSSPEEQVLQNFFNNPPQKDNSPQGGGDLNYDLVHSGVAIKNLQGRSLTPASNLVEPPSSACSEFSELNNSSASSKSYAPDTKLPNQSSVSVAPIEKAAEVPSSSSENLEGKEALEAFEKYSKEIKKHYQELPEEILQELRMAANNLNNHPIIPDTPYSPPIKHWFYKKVVGGKVSWIPFSHYDSALIETTYTQEITSPELVAVEGGRFDVNIKERVKVPVYWEEKPIEVKRCSWFYKGPDSKYMPYDEDIADFLEQEYQQAKINNEWHKKIMLSMGEYVIFHGPTVLVHFKQQANTDPWGGASPSATRPRVVKRDLDDFNIPPGDSQKVDHLLFMVHGIGSVCDMKMRTLHEVVEDFRTVAQQLVQSHYKNSTEIGVVGRVEVLPISWHSHLHSADVGIDEKLKSITLDSIPLLRNFTNDTLLDVLFYTSPVYCQRIMNTVAASLNSVYMKYRQRNPEFNGSVSMAGHSLGSIILFDLLCHQQPIKETEEQNMENPDLHFLSETPESNSVVPSSSAPTPMSYMIGHAGTGQPFIQYGQLVFQPKKFFALGSPIGMFVAIRGIDKLGLDFRLPTCPGFYNIFHPFDPVAYRIEALVNPDMAGIRPVLIPHHKGRKRMHLELKETVTRVGADLKQRFMDTFKTTLESVNFFASSSRNKKQNEENIQREVDQVLDQIEEQEKQVPSPLKSEDNTSLTVGRERTSSVSTTISDSEMVEIDFPLGKLNDSKRIDYVLQEAPLEFFNEYLFAMSSHMCYWESEDTILFVMKEIYNGLGVSPDSQVPQQSMIIERPVQKEMN